MRLAIEVIGSIVFQLQCFFSFEVGKKGASYKQNIINLIKYLDNVLGM